MERTESILWMQHEDASKNGYLVVNNKFVPIPDVDDYREINKKLLKVFSVSIFDRNVVKKYVERNKNQYFQVGSGLFKGVSYRSRFNENDIKGNAQPFMFWISSLHLSSFAEYAKTSAEVLGKSLDANELCFVEKYIKRIRTRRFSCCGIAVLIIVLVLLIL